MLKAPDAGKRPREGTEDLLDHPQGIVIEDVEVMEKNKKLRSEEASALLHVGEASNQETSAGIKQINNVDPEAYLDRHLNLSNSDNLSMALVDRAEHIGIISNAAAHFHGKGCIVYGYSMDGSGKTALLKRASHEIFDERLKHGRLIVRCCQRTTSYDSKWIEDLMSSRHEAAVCHLVQAHLEELTGYDGPDFRDPAEAYETWIQMTKQAFGAYDWVNPVVLIDSCESLANGAHESLVHESGVRYTQLEAFCLAIPSRFSIVAVGCSAGITTSELILSERNVHILPPLSALDTVELLMKAQKSWEIGEVDEKWVNPLLELSGGIPRVMRWTALEIKRIINDEMLTLSDLSSNWTKLDSENKNCKDASTQAVRFSCFLISSTKFTIHSLDEEVPLPPTLDGMRFTFADASKLSIATLSSNRERKLLVVAPLTMPDVAMFGISPTGLHPCLQDEYWGHVGAESAESVQFRELSLTKAFVYALYARYLLVLWRTRAVDGWVPLCDVLADALPNFDESLSCEAVEVNLKDGLAIVEDHCQGTSAECEVMNRLTWCTNRANAHHDAYMWCRKRHFRDGAVAAAIDVLHDIEEPATKLNKRLMANKSNLVLDSFPLFAVYYDTRAIRSVYGNFVFVNACEMLQASHKPL